MDLWIRSQDRKRLIPNPNLYVVESEAGISYVGDTMVGHIGNYKNLERALEVLDEIQKLLEPKVIVKANTGVAKSLYENVFQEVEIYSQESLNSSRIYQMPEK